jgi:hypothetical protein
MRTHTIKTELTGQPQMKSTHPTCAQHQTSQQQVLFTPSQQKKVLVFTQTSTQLVKQAFATAE